MQPISPDVNEAASLLFLELLDACNHLVVQTVSIRSPSKSIRIVNFCFSQHMESPQISSEKMTCFVKVLFISPKNRKTCYIRALYTRPIGGHSTCKQLSRFSSSSSQELEQDPCLLVTAKETGMKKTIV